MQCTYMHMHVAYSCHELDGRHTSYVIQREGERAEPVHIFPLNMHVVVMYVYLYIWLGEGWGGYQGKRMSKSVITATLQTFALKQIMNRKIGREVCGFFFLVQVQKPSPRHNMT